MQKRPKIKTLFPWILTRGSSIPNGQIFSPKCVYVYSEGNKWLAYFESFRTLEFTKRHQTAPFRFRSILVHFASPFALWLKRLPSKTAKMKMCKVYLQCVSSVPFCRQIFETAKEWKKWGEIELRAPVELPYFPSCVRLRLGSLSESTLASYGCVQLIFCLLEAKKRSRRNEFWLWS